MENRFFLATVATFGFFVAVFGNWSRTQQIQRRKNTLTERKEKLGLEIRISFFVKKEMFCKPVLKDKRLFECISNLTFDE